MANYIISNFKSLTIGALSLAMLAGMGCSNKAREQCLADVDKYEAGKLKCMAMTDATEREACTSLNEVHAITRENCLE